MKNYEKENYCFINCIYDAFLCHSFAFGGCDNMWLLTRIDELEEKIEILNEQMDELKEQIRQQESINQLSTHRTNAITSLIDYVGAMLLSHFSDEKWIVIQKYVIEGIAAINAAVNRAGIDAALVVAKMSIGEVETTVWFNFTDPKIYWDGSFDGVQFDSVHSVVIEATFRRIRDGMLLPMFEASDFGFMEYCTATLFELLLEHLPKEVVEEFFEERLFFYFEDMVSLNGYFHFSYTNNEWETRPSSDLRQRAMIYLSKSNPETFTSIIRHLEKLDFIKSARPVNILYLHGSSDR